MRPVFVIYRKPILKDKQLPAGSEIFMLSMICGTSQSAAPARASVPLFSSGIISTFVLGTASSSPDTAAARPLEQRPPRKAVRQCVATKMSLSSMQAIVSRY